MKFFLLQLSRFMGEDDSQINKKLPKELILRILSYLDVVSLCRCAQVSKLWNVLALDGSNWQRIDLFDFQRDVEVFKNNMLELIIKAYCIKLLSGTGDWKHITKMWWISKATLTTGVRKYSRWIHEDSRSSKLHLFFLTRLSLFFSLKIFL